MQRDYDEWMMARAANNEYEGERARISESYKNHIARVARKEGIKPWRAADTAAFLAGWDEYDLDHSDTALKIALGNYYAATRHGE